MTAASEVGYIREILQQREGQVVENFQAIHAAWVIR